MSAHRKPFAWNDPFTDIIFSVLNQQAFVIFHLLHPFQGAGIAIAAGPFRSLEMPVCTEDLFLSCDKMKKQRFYYHR
jgi:hypothetical protein